MPTQAEVDAAIAVIKAAKEDEEKKRAVLGVAFGALDRVAHATYIRARGRCAGDAGKVLVCATWYRVVSAINAAQVHGNDMAPAQKYLSELLAQYPYLAGLLADEPAGT